jgi:hypothetical protein
MLDIGQVLIEVYLFLEFQFRFHPKLTPIDIIRRIVLGLAQGMDVVLGPSSFFREPIFVRRPFNVVGEEPSRMLGWFPLCVKACQAELPFCFDVLSGKVSSRWDSIMAATFWNRMTVVMRSTLWWQMTTTISRQPLSHFPFPLPLALVPITLRLPNPRARAVRIGGVIIGGTVWTEVPPMSSWHVWILT